MKASELRIGNYIEVNGEIRQVTSGIIVTIDTISKPDTKPIPLTEEWLLKFGFDEKGIGYAKGFIYLWHYDDGIFLELVSDSNSHNTPLKYVHQLQNLYFALTGEELTIKD